MSEKHGKKMGIDPAQIVLDEAGRFELNDEQLALVTGGAKPKLIVIEKCEHKPITVIRSTTCTQE